MFIAIPSAGRPDKQITLRNLTSIGMRVKNEVYVCVPMDQMKRYKGYMREGAELIGVPNELRGIAPTRQWILETLTKKVGDPRVLMLDDDMDFCYRPDVKAAPLETITTTDKLQSMVDRLESWLESGFVHVGLSARQGNNREYIGENGRYELHEYRDATRMMNAYAYDINALRKARVVLGRMEVMEDFDLTLQLLRKGLANRVLFEYCWNQRGSGKTGGCSTYRTPEMQARAAHRLKEFHPDFVEIKVKTSKASSESWRGMKERVDVQVRWRDAYAAGGGDVAAITGGKGRGA